MKASSMDSIIKRFLILFPEDKGISPQELAKIEKILEIRFPQDFKEISKYYSGGNIGGLSIFTFNANLEDEYSVVLKNLLYREKINLPKNFIALYDEYGFLLLNTEATEQDPGSVIDLSSTDIFRIIENKPFESQSKYYKNFTAFFEYLIGQEEEERKTAKT